VSIARAACLVVWATCILAVPSYAQPSSETTDAPAAPESPAAPTPPGKDHEPPSIRSMPGPQGESIILANHAVKVELRVDASKRIQITSLQTQTGRELLVRPADCFSIVNGDGTSFKEGSAFRLDSWHMWLHISHAEVELKLAAPEPVTWRLRLYRDKPYLEQRFELPEGWRVTNRALVEALPTSPHLRPIMPVNVMKRGFKKGVANVPGRNRFEFVDSCEHLVYDPDGRCGLAAFVAGVGGEEKMTAGEVRLLDHATATLGRDDPLARVVLFPFEGPVEKGFLAVRRFISGEYSCEKDIYSRFTWNQFWLWQGKHQDWGYHEVTAARLLDILPHLTAIGVEALHLDAGWELGTSSTPRPTAKEWIFDPVRFPEGFAPIQKYLRGHGMGYITHLFTKAVDDPSIIMPIIENTDLDKLFIDANANEKTLAGLRLIRKKYPDFEVLVHSMNDARRASSFWKWGNIHYLSDINQIYFGEGTWQGYVSDLPPHMTKPRFIDLFTRCAAYQAGWIWPYKTIHPPHAGYTMGGMPWYVPDMDVKAASSLILTMMAACYTYQWGDDPRLVAPDTLSFFLDWTAFWKTFRPYVQEYQHVLPPPDGIHIDGAAHLQGGRGFMVLFNPGSQEQDVTFKELLWSPELELDPRRPVELTDWTEPLDPAPLPAVDLANPGGAIPVTPLGYRVLGINLDLEQTRAEVRRQRSLLSWPPTQPSGPPASRPEGVGD
jgi:hypothetical protein